MASPKPASAPRRKEASSHTKDKANAAKAYIEAKYSRMKAVEEEKRQGWQELQERMDEMHISGKEQQLIK
jgi:serine/threonine kinase 38